MSYPNDADGNALANIAASGMDMEKMAAIEFAIAVPNGSVGKAVVALVSEIGYQTVLYFDEGEPDYEEGEDEEFGPSWTVYAVASMRPTYENVVRCQSSINKLVAGIGGHCDGWEVKLSPDR